MTAAGHWRAFLAWVVAGFLALLASLTFIGIFLLPAALGALFVALRITRSWTELLGIGGGLAAVCALIVGLDDGGDSTRPFAVALTIAAPLAVASFSAMRGSQVARHRGDAGAVAAAMLLAAWLVIVVLA